MIRSATKSETLSTSLIIPVAQVIGGSIFLALMSQVALPLPFTVVPLTMQLFAVLMLGVTLGSRKGALSVLTFLLQGTMGLPVFAGGLAKPLWFMTPVAGYLVGFVLAAFIVGALLEKTKTKSFTLTALIMMIGAACVTLTGGLVMTLFVGLKPAINMGIIPFIAPDMLKALMAAACVAPVRYLAKKF